MTGVGAGVRGFSYVPSSIRPSEEFICKDTNSSVREVAV